MMSPSAAGPRMNDLFAEYSWILIFVAATLALPYLVGPFLIRRNVTHPLEPDLVPFPPDLPSLPNDVAATFSAATRQLGAVGFEVLSGFGLPRQMPNVKAVVLLFANRATKDMAMATAIYGEAADGSTLQTHYVEIASVFRDETVVQTNNCDQLSAFRARPPVHTTQFPQVADAARLFRLHAALCRRFAPAALKAMPLDEEFGGDAQAYLAAALREELDRQIPTGYMERDEAAGIYRPTVKGAFLMTWGELFPFKQIRRLRRDRQARELLAELEAEGALDAEPRPSGRW